MGSKGVNRIGQETADKIVALRELWHTKDHRFFVEFHQGEIGLEPLGRLMVQHYQHVTRAYEILDDGKRITSKYTSLAIIQDFMGAVLDP